MNTLHDYEETGAEFKSRREIMQAYNKEKEKEYNFIKTREKNIAIFSNMVGKCKRSIMQGKFKF